MGLRFRRSVKILPGVRLNISGRGISASLGRPGATVNVGKGGVRSVTVGLPGTGISYKHTFRKIANNQAVTPAPSLRTPARHKFVAPVVPGAPAAPRIQHTSTPVESSAIYTLTSPSLLHLRDLVTNAYFESQRLAYDLADAEARKATAERRAASWDHGRLRKTLFPDKHVRVLDDYVTARIQVSELRQALSRCQITLGFDPAIWTATSYTNVLASFQTLTTCNQSWDVTQRTRVARFQDRSSAAMTMERSPIRPDVADCRWIAGAGPAPHLPNTNGGDLFLFPTMLFIVQRDRIALVDLRDVRAEFQLITFNEEQRPPYDAPVVGRTWKWVNMDGSPDRRFANNFVIPVLAYGLLRLTSTSGLHEEYLFSNPEKAQDFALALESHRSAISTQA